MFLTNQNLTNDSNIVLLKDSIRFLIDSKKKKKIMKVHKFKFIYTILHQTNGQ